MYYILAALLFITGSLSATCNARVDVGPAFVSIDMLESGKTVRTLNLGALRGDATVTVLGGLCLKPGLLLADGKANLNTASLGVGYCIPLPFQIVATPSVGYTETHFCSKLDLPQYNPFKLKERFTSRGQYIALDVSWTFIKGWRLYAIGQWCSSHVRTKIGDFPAQENRCRGPNYALILEHDLTDQLSINIAGGYNSSLSKEKHGLRGKGVKLGLAYWW